jgi:hypothetical protein
MVLGPPITVTSPSNPEIVTVVGSTDSSQAGPSHYAVAGSSGGGRTSLDVPPAGSRRVSMPRIVPRRSSSLVIDDSQECDIAEQVGESSTAGPSTVRSSTHIVSEGYRGEAMAEDTSLDNPIPTETFILASQIDEQQQQSIIIPTEPSDHLETTQVPSDPALNSAHNHPPAEKPSANRRKNELLNLPPPPPFHLQVKDLSVGIPDRLNTSS